MVAIPFIERFMGPKGRAKPLPTDPVPEKARNLMHAREQAQRPLPSVPVPVQAYQSSTLLQPQQQFHRTSSHRTPSQTHHRRRTVSQGQQPLRGILKNKGQTNPPPVQASGGFDDYPHYVSQSWPSASSHPSARSGYAMGQLDYLAENYPSAVDDHHAYAYHGANVVAPQVERRRSIHPTTSRSRPQYQPSDSPVSDDSDHPNNGGGAPVAVMQVHASNYISAYIKPVRMKPEAYHLNWPLKTAKLDRQGKMPRRIYFDIAFNPRENEGRNIRICDQTQFLRSMNKEELELPVTTHCMLTDMTIVHNEPQFSAWPIKVHRREGIRCIDVFVAIYESFHRSLKPEDPISEEEKKYADRHRKRRCQDASGLYEYNWRQGLLRVDILRSRRIFAGLEQDGSQWKLQLNSYMAT